MTRFRRSGGIIFYFKDYLVPGIADTKRLDNTLWIKLDASFFQIKQDNFMMYLRKFHYFVILETSL